MSRPFQFSLKWLLVLTIAIAGYAVQLRLLMSDLAKKGGEGSELHFIAVGIPVMLAVFWVVMLFAPSVRKKSDPTA